MNLKKLIFGKEYEINKVYDECLNLFDNSGYLTFDQLAKSIKPEHYIRVVNFLMDEKLAEQIGYGLRITAKGQDIKETGGLAGRIVRKWFNCLGVVIGVIAALVAILTVFGVF